MKKIISLLVLLTVFVSCKEEAVAKPDHLIEKSKMVDIMYDLAILEGVKYQNPSSKDSNKINPVAYIYKKYKIDSTQLAQSNVYYASDYAEYKNMYDTLIKRIEIKKITVDSILKIENKIKMDSLKIRKAKSVSKDSLLLIKKQQAIKKGEIQLK